MRKENEEKEEREKERERKMKKYGMVWLKIKLDRKNKKN